MTATATSSTPSESVTMSEADDVLRIEHVAGTDGTVTVPEGFPAMKCWPARSSTRPG